MQKYFHTAIPWIFLPLAIGCAITEPYVPNRPPVPLISHKGEFNVSGGEHFPLAAGLDYEAVYAPWNHISLYGAMQFDQGHNGADGLLATPYYNNQFFEIGVGYFNSVSSWAQYEAYLQVGLGSGSDVNFPWLLRDYTASSDTTSLKVFRIGIQENIGTESDFGAIGIGLGLGYELFYNLNRTSTNYDWLHYDTLTTFPTVVESSPRSTLYAEPVIFWRFGYKNVKIMQEFWWTYNTSSYSLFRGGNESLTLSLDF
jgi:hypothetical protein